MKSHRSRRKHWVFRALAAAGLAALTPTAKAQEVAPPIAFVGQVSTNGAQPASVNLVFEIYSQKSGGARLWGPVARNNVPVVGGRFSTTLATAADPPLASETLAGADRWLGTTVNGVPMVSRRRLFASQYAVVANDAPERLDEIDRKMRWRVDVDLVSDIRPPYVAGGPGQPGVKESVLAPGLVPVPATGSADAGVLCASVPSAGPDCGAELTRVGVTFTPPAGSNRVDACLSFSSQWGRINGGRSFLLYLRETDLTTGGVVDGGRVEFLTTPFDANNGLPLRICDSFPARARQMAIELRVEMPAGDPAWAPNAVFDVYPSASFGGFHWDVTAR